MIIVFKNEYSDIAREMQAAAHPKTWRKTMFSKYDLNVKVSGTYVP